MRLASSLVLLPVATRFSHATCRHPASAPTTKAENPQLIDSLFVRRAGRHRIACNISLHTTHPSRLPFASPSRSAIVDETRPLMPAYATRHCSFSHAARA
ncbi:hypothetical protein F4802DRAFT_184891 [Xylaria palmicola]|nr:hypothetical protein F4802DRAFT_184891 [Xylaria palmicola]